MVGEAQSSSLLSQKSALEALWGGVAAGLARSYSPFFAGSAHLIASAPGVLGTPVPDRAGRIIRKKSRVQKFKKSCPSFKEKLQTRKGETERFPERES